MKALLIKKDTLYHFKTRVQIWITFSGNFRMSINNVFHKTARGLPLALASVVLLMMAATGTNADSSNTQPGDDAFKTVEWTDLMPEEDLNALSNPPEYINEVEDGSFEDQINDQFQNTINTIAEDRYQQALVSTSVVSELNGESIRIPGFIVPLEFNDDQTITQFFLVPYFGACIHMPPPPPNQMIFVNYPKGLKLNALYDPFWISGVLKTSLQENDMATSAYAMDMQTFESYQE
jgi:hypothetical protein